MIIEKTKQFIRYNQLKELYEKYERMLIPATLVFGVIIDSITFSSIDITTAFILLGAYALIAGATIIFMHAYDAERISKESSAFRYLRLASPLIIQFTFGALLSASFIFYLFSGTLFVSWPFILAIVLLMISNDVFRHYYLRPLVQISVLFFILLSLIAVVFPFIFSTIGTLVFLFSGTVSLLFIFGYIALAQHLIPSFVAIRKRMWTGVIVIFVCINGLYFLKVIPPIPLALRDVAVAHSIQRNGASYMLRVENAHWYDRFIPKYTIHKVNDVVVYTAVFAPRELQTTIVHQWEYLDEKKGEWVKRDRLPFNIIGGRNSGFRGYTRKSNVQIGKWRVSVETERGQVLGRVRMNVEEAHEVPSLEIIQK